MSFHVIIPVRYDSTRLPGKALLDIANKPMIQHVYEQANKSAAQTVTIATDSEKIHLAAKNFAAQVYMTATSHPNGTNRIAECVNILKLDDAAIVVNVQGDLPLIPPKIINQVAANLAQHPQASVATLCHEINDNAILMNPNVVKVVMDKFGYALYFSRAAIPWKPQSSSLMAIHYKHIGIYAYRVGFLQRYKNWDSCALEQAESLEQLRILWQGERIHVGITSEIPHPGVDTEEDLVQVRSLVNNVLSHP